MTGEAKKRVLFYLLLAIVCYATAAYVGEEALGFILFLVGGMIAELIFWRHLYLRVRDRLRR